FASSSSARGRGLLGGVAGTAGGTVGGAAGIGSGLDRTAASSGGSIMGGSAGSVGGVSSGGHLLAGRHGVFCMRGVDLVDGTHDSAQGSVLTSHSGNVQLGRGTHMLLATQSAGSASGAADTATQGAAQRDAIGPTTTSSATATAEGTARTNPGGATDLAG